MAITWYTSAGQPSDSVGVAGDLDWDTTNRIVWLKQANNSWVGGQYSNIGPTGPAMLAGSGAPTASYGQIGNGYVDATSGNIWLKSSSGWAQTGTINVNTNYSAVLQGAGPPNASTAPTVAVGQMYLDTTNSLLYPPATAATYTGFTATPINVVGPTGASAQVQPALGNLASVWGPGSVLNGVAGGTTYIPTQNAGLNNAAVYVPPVNSSVTGVQVTNFSNTGKTVYLYLADSTGAVFVNVNAGNGVASGTVVNYLYTAGTYSMTAGSTYTWMAGLASAGTIYCAVNPIYTLPSTGPGISYYPMAVNLTPGTAYTLSTSNQYLGTAGATSQQWYYKYNLASYLYGLQATVTGSGTVQLVLYNTSGSAAIWTSPAITLSTTAQTLNYGPFGVGTAPILSGNNCSWAVIGSGTLTAVNIATAVGM